MKFFRIFLLSLIVFLSIPQTAVAAEESSGFCVWNLPVISWVIRNKPCQQAAEKKANDEKELISPLPTVAAAIDTSQDIATSSAISPEYSLQIAPFMAGTGISIKGNRISNTGVLSLVAGNGIEILKSAIVNTDKGSAQNIFKEFKVHDQDTISATSNNDALTFESGDGISLSTDKDNRKIKITNTATSSSSDGWNNSSGVVSAGDTSANVSIGSTSSIGKLGIVGDTDEKTLVVRGASGQTNRLIDIQNSSGNSLASFNSSGAMTIGENQGISLTANTPTTGTITRLISLRATSQYDRPWISSIDHNARHVAAFGIHSVDINDETEQKRWEVKTVADALGSIPAVMLTRFAIDYDRDLADIIFSQTDTVGIHNDYGDRTTFVHQMRDSGDTGSYQIGKWSTELDGSDNTVMTFDPKTMSNTKDATLRLFRETNTSGQRRLVLNVGDNTSTESIVLNAGTGVIDTNANAAGITTGDGTNTSSYINMQSNRTMVGYDGSSAVLQSGTDKKLKLNVNTSSFGAGTAMTIDTAGSVGIGTVDPGTKLHVNYNAEGLRLGDGTNVSSYTNMAGNRTMVGYDGSNAVIQGGTSKGIKFNVNNASFGSGTAMTLTSGGFLGIGTATVDHLVTLSGGAYSDGANWTNSSDRNQKENFTDIDSLEVLQKIVNLPVQQWNYKQDGEEVKHIGPVAQDFKAAFNVGENDTSISTIDPAGIALVGIKALNQRINELEKRIGGEPSVVASSESKAESSSNTQTSGKVKVEKTKDHIEVTFEKELEETPVVTASVMLNDNGDDESKEARKAFFDQNIQYVITKQTTKGFTIQLNKDTQTDIEFNWIASGK